MDILVLIGRIFFVALFLGAGVNHVTNAKMMIGYAGAKGVPAPAAANYAGAVLLFAGGLSVLLGVWADLGTLLLLAFLVPTSVLMHAFWKEEGDARQLDMIQFQKNMALAGAALMLFAFFAYVGDDLGLTLTGPLFDLG